MKGRELFRSGTVPLRLFCRMGWRVAGRIPPWLYAYRCFIYQRKMRTVEKTIHRNRLAGPVETADIRDNTGDFAFLSFAYRGLEEVKALIAGGAPVVFIAWHQGASGRNYAICRALPETAIFTRETFQYGTTFSCSMLRAKGLSLVKIERFLRQGRPIKYSIDGIPLGDTVRVPVLGVPSDLPAAPIRVMRSVRGVRFVPVTAYFRRGYTVEIIFHPPHPSPGDLPAMSDREVLEAWISFLERDLVKEAPEQVRWTFLSHRERLAREKS